MEERTFYRTTVGCDYYKGLVINQVLPTDVYLDYILEMQKLLEDNSYPYIWKEKFQNEINATKEILKKLI